MIRNTRYRAGATPYPDRTSTGWIAPASPGAHKQTLSVRDHAEPEPGVAQAAQSFGNAGEGLQRVQLARGEAGLCQRVSDIEEDHPNIVKYHDRESPFDNPSP